MELRAEITAQQGNEVTLKLHDPLLLKTLLNSEFNGKYWAILDTYEKEKITPDQRKHIYALFQDYVEYTGVPLDAVEAYFKYWFMIDFDLGEFPSLARNAMSMTIASEFISYLVTYYIQNGIPFRKQQFYLTTDTSKMLYAMLMKRICWSCGKPNAEIAHYEAVGMGRDRKTIDHTQHHFMCLCSNCHKIQHQIGIESFMQTEHIKPIKLKLDDLKYLGVM
ncbi:putative HNHc nuclease [Aerococcus viridans]